LIPLAQPVVNANGNASMAPHLSSESNTLTSKMVNR
jgi:hypothetical protein